MTAINISSNTHKLCTTLKTYGPKPCTFKLEDGDEDYMLGSEVGNHLRLFRGDLYKKYPSLWRRKMTAEERKMASEQIGYSHCNISSNVMLVKATEVDEVIAGLEEKYRTAQGCESSFSISNDRNTTLPHGNSSFSTAPQSLSRGSKKTSWLSQIPNYSYHLDAVPSATPVTHYKIGSKKIKSFPTL